LKRDYKKGTISHVFVTYWKGDKMNQDKIKVAFREIPGFPGYEINAMGIVFSNITKREIRGQVSAKGYRSHCLSLNKKPKVMRTHRLVAMTFIGPPPSAKHQVNHKDGDKLNNFVDNLEWVTAKQNIDHSNYVLGNLRTGEAVNLSKLNDMRVLVVKTLKFNPEWETKRLAAVFNVNESTIRRIKWGTHWKHI
jgi:hypothetical protein